MTALRYFTGPSRRRAGVIAENVYLASAALGLGTVVRASVDRAALAKALHLGPEQRIVLCQSVGYPRK